MNTNLPFIYILQEYQWAIGTSQGSVDLQTFRSVGLNQTAVNDELVGSLIHNHTYFVTMKALNTAGVITTYEAEGLLLFSSDIKINE